MLIFISYDEKIIIMLLKQSTFINKYQNKYNLLNKFFIILSALLLCQLSFGIPIIVTVCFHFELQNLYLFEILIIYFYKEILIGLIFSNIFMKLLIKKCFICF